MVNGMSKFLYMGTHMLVVVGGYLTALSIGYFLVKKWIENNYEWKDGYEKK